MYYFMFIITLVYLAAGLAQYFIAPKVGPNPYFGFRVGYTLSDREVWNKANRFLGLLMTIHGLFLLPLSLILDVLWFLILFLVPMLVFIPIGIKYAANLLELKGAKSGIVGERKMEPIVLGFAWLITPMLFYSILLLYMAFTYPQLPSVLAVHFDAAGNPNGWATKESFFVSYAAYSLILPGTAYLFAYLGYRYPMYVHPGRTRFPRDAYLKTLFLAMDVALLFEIFIYYSIYLYAMQGIMLSIGYTLIFTIIIVLVPIGYLVSKWRR
ncbi:MAG: DUF1648 domain-containing protein [Euryarchaeota archaeon]|nr:DUF1648 domain-containing protein [Euryarchaeota archaeon]